MASDIMEVDTIIDIAAVGLISSNAIDKLAKLIVKPVVGRAIIEVSLIRDSSQRW